MIIAISLVCTAVLCGARASLEMGDKTLSVVMSESDIQLLAHAEGMSYDEYLNLLLSGGLTAPYHPNEVNDQLELFLGDNYDGTPATVGLIEDGAQHENLPIAGFEYDDDAQVVRAFHLVPEFAARYATLGYEDAKEIENILYRAVTERAVRVVILTPFTHGQTGELISDSEQYTSLLLGLSERIARHGISLGQFSVLPPYTPNFVLSAGVIAGITACGVLLLSSLFSMTSRVKIGICILCFAAAMLLWIYYPPAIPLAASIIFPCLSLWMVAHAMTTIVGGFKSLAKAYIVILLASFAVVLLGGLAIGGLCSSRAQLLSIETFSGVKLSQIAPLCYGLLIFCKLLFPGKGPIDIAKAYLSHRILLLLGIVAVSVIVGLFLLRSGHSVITGGVLEQRFRNALEEFFIARPRSKEFAGAWPALGLAIAVMAKWGKMPAAPLGVLTGIGFTSAINSFCHYRTTLFVSTSRELIALAIGAIIGLLAIAFICLVFKNRQKINR